MTDDETKAARDALIFGTGYMLDGKHVPMEDVMTDKLIKWLRRELPMGDDCIAPNKVCVAGDCPCDDANVIAAADRIEALDKRNKELEAALTGAEAWIDRWTKHVGNCAGGSVCGCGRTFVLHEIRAALGEKRDAD